MEGLKSLLALGILIASISNKDCTASAPSPSPSLDLFFPVRPQDATNQSSASTTLAPTISERIQSSLNNVLRVPFPVWGTVPIFPASETPSASSTQQQPATPAVTQAQVTAGGNQQHQRQQLEQQSQVGGSQSAPPPSSFLPDVNQGIGILSTIAHLSTLTHWPFAYMTTGKPQQQQQQRQTTPPPPTNPPTVPTTQVPTTTTAPPTTAAPSTTTTQAATTVQSTTIPSTPIPVPSPLPTAAALTQAMTYPSNINYYPPTVPAYLLPPTDTRPMYPAQSGNNPPSIPERIHNRIHSTINNYVRLPDFSQLGQNRPRPMITEPPWVTELLGPTKEPPTTRSPTLGERVQNSLQNVLLFVPATLLNFWYTNWGPSHVDRIINRLQIPTGRPGSPAQPIFATIPNNRPNPFANFSASSFGGGAMPDLPAIAAFINNNGTLMPTIVHPVVNKTANTIEYQLRSDNETTVLWTGMLSNDVFFGNKRGEDEEVVEIDDEEEDQKIKNIALNIKEKV